MRKLTSLLLTLCMVLALTACGNKEKAAMESKEVSTESEEEITFEKGSIDGDTYTNTSIGIKITAPEGFKMADADTMALMEEEVIQNLTEQNGSIDATEAVNYEVVMTTLDGFSFSVYVAAEDMTKSSGMAVSTKFYIKILETQMETEYTAMGFTTVETESLGTVEIGGKEFEGLKVVAEVGELNIMQNYYLYRVGDVMFEIITTGSSDSEEILEQFINSVEAVE